MEFFDSKKFGDIAEKEILERIQNQYPQAYIDDRGKANSDWDIWIPEKQYGIEVKTDYKSKETGNIVIEVEMNGSLSALSVTKAEYWVWSTGFDYIWITPLDIYRHIEQNPHYSRAKFIAKGDTTEKCAYLASLSIFLKYVKNLSKPRAWVEDIKENDVLYYDNMMKRIENL